MNQKPKGWWPGMYEGKTPQEVQAQVGTHQYESKFQGQGTTPASMRGIRDTRVAFRHGGTICRSLNGIMK